MTCGRLAIKRWRNAVAQGGSEWDDCSGAEVLPSPRSTISLLG